MKKHFLTRQTIVLDLDDTLIDTKKRQYFVIRDFFEEKGIQIGNFDSYINYRIQNHCSNYTYAQQYFVSEAMANEFRQFFIKEIEIPKYLENDKLIVDRDLLKETANQFDFVLLSLRSSELNSINQIKHLDLMNFFKEIHFLPHSADNNPKSKILEDLKTKYPVESFVGDTIYDYQAAVSNQIKFIGVETGLFNLEIDSKKFSSINKYFSCINSAQKN